MYLSKEEEKAEVNSKLWLYIYIYRKKEKHTSGDGLQRVRHDLFVTNRHFCFFSFFFCLPFYHLDYK